MSKLITWILLLVLFLSCQTEMQRVGSEKLIAYNEFLGVEKASVLDAMVGSFESFLNLNYPDQNGQSDQIQSFLECFLVVNKADSIPTWSFETERNKTILDKYERSGLRREIVLYWKEEYDYEKEYGSEYMIDSVKQDTSNWVDVEVIEFKESKWDSADSVKLVVEMENWEKQMDTMRMSYPEFHAYGKYLQGLKLVTLDDTNMLEYVDVKEAPVDISPVLLLEGLLMYSDQKDYSQPLIKRVIVIEFYLMLMKWDAKRTS